MGVGGAKGVEWRRKPFRRQPRRRTDHENMRGMIRIQTFDGFADVRKTRLQAWVQLLAGSSERDRAYTPLEQLYAEEFFEALYLMAERTRRHAQLPGRVGQAQMP